MRIPTSDQLFPHDCDISDMQVSGFTPTSIRYHCKECGGMLLIKMSKDQWQETFGRRKTLALTSKVLKEGEVLVDPDDIQHASVEMPHPDKFVWTPPEDIEIPKES